ncbi:MAG: hypothetical protein ACOVMI_03700 [Chitinophagaceae bacterium]
MNEVFALKNEKSWQSAIIHENQILLINKSYKTQDEFLAKFNDKSFFRSTKTININSIHQLTHLENNPEELTISYDTKKTEKLKFESNTQLQTFCNTIVTTNNFNGTVQSLSTFKAIQSSLIGIVISAVVGWLLYTEAAILEAGGTIEITGRKRLFKEILAKGAEILGTTGSLIAASAAIIFFGFLLYKKSKTPPTEVIYQ